MLSKTVLTVASLLGLGAAQTTQGATAICLASGNTTGLINSDTNVAYVDGYYGLTDPTVGEQGGVSALPWSYPFDKCTTSAASSTAYWKFTCMDDGDWVLAQGYALDSTCTGEVVANHTIDMNSTLSYRCGAGTTEAWFRAQMYLASGDDFECGDDQPDTYGVVGNDQCELTLIPATNDASVPGFANFYCDKQGLVLNTYEYSQEACMGDACVQNGIDEGNCAFLIAATVGDLPVEVWARPQECMSAEDGQCRDGSTGECQSSDDDDAANTAAVAFAAVVGALVAAMQF